jgi:cytoskeletal protein RodZ
MNKQTLRVCDEQAELLGQIGTYLRDLRQYHALSLEDVESRTLIPVRTLHAIEEGDLNRLPEPVYVQGFIRRYADAIGANGSEFANAFPTDPHLISSGHSSRKRPIQAQLRPIHLYLLYTLLVLGAVSGISYMLNRSAGNSLQYASIANPKSGLSTAQTPLEFYGPPLPGQVGLTKPITAKATTPKSDKPVRINLVVTGQQAWLRVEVDGQTNFEGMLSQGAERNWSANERVTIRAGDAGAIEVSYNEGEAKPIGKPGDVKEVTFSAGSQASENHASSTDLADSSL